HRRPGPYWSWGRNCGDRDRAVGLKDRTLRQAQGLCDKLRPFDNVQGDAGRDALADIFGWSSKGVASANRTSGQARGTPVFARSTKAVVSDDVRFVGERVVPNGDVDILDSGHVL